MKKNYIFLSGLILLVVLMAGIYMIKSSGSAGDADSEASENAGPQVNVHETSPDSLGLTDAEIRELKGVPEKGGMKWSYTDKEIFKKTFGTAEGLDELAVFDVTNNVNEQFMKKLTDMLGLDKDDRSLNETADGFYYEDINGKIPEETVELIINDLHLGVWKDSVNYGTIHQYGDHAYELTYEFNGYQWKSDVYGSGSSGKNILYGIESAHSMMWESDDNGYLEKFSGFSYELKERNASNQFHTLDAMEEFVTDAMNQYASLQNENGEITEDSFPLFEEFDITGLEICYSREIPSVYEDSSMFVPVLVLSGEMYTYWTEDDYWEAVHGFYAVSLESGEVYVWQIEM